MEKLNTCKRLLAILLTVAMLMSLFTGMVGAETGTGEPEEGTVEVPPEEEGETSKLEETPVEAWVNIKMVTKSTEEGPGDEEPTESTGNAEPAEDTGNEEPAEDTGNEEPAEDTGNEEPAEDTGNEEPAEDNGNEEPAEDNGSEEPAEDNGNEEPAGGSDDENVAYIYTPSLKVGGNEISHDQYSMTWYNADEADPNRQVVDYDPWDEDNNAIGDTYLFAVICYDGVYIKIPASVEKVLTDDGQTEGNTESAKILSNQTLGTLDTTGVNSITLPIPAENPDGFDAKRLIIEYSKECLEVKGTTVKAVEGATAGEVEIKLSLLNSALTAILDSCTYSVKLVEPKLAYSISHEEDEDLNVNVTFSVTAESEADFALIPDEEEYTCNSKIMQVTLAQKGEELVKEGTVDFTSEGIFELNFHGQTTTITVDKKAPVMEINVGDATVLSNDGRVFVRVDPVEADDQESIDLTLTVTVSDVNLVLEGYPLPDGVNKEDVQEVNGGETGNNTIQYEYVVTCEADKITEIELPCNYVDAKGKSATVNLTDKDDGKVDLTPSGNTVSFVVDRQRPYGSAETLDIIITPDVSTTVYTGEKIDFTVTVTDGEGSGIKSVTYSVTDKKEALKKVEESTISENEGTYSVTVEVYDKTETDCGELTVSATDKSGNVRTVVKTIQADRKAPEITISGIPVVETEKLECTYDGVVYSADEVRLTVEISDLFLDDQTLSVKCKDETGSDIEIAVDFKVNEATGSYVAEVEITDTDGGIKTGFVASASDTNGHSITNADYEGAQFVVDTTNPVANFSKFPETKKQTRFEVSIEERNLDENKVQIICILEESAEPVTVEDVAWSHNGDKHKVCFELPSMENQIKGVQVTVTDKAGRNSEPKTHILAENYDKDPPVVSITLPTNSNNNPNNTVDGVEYYQKAQTITVKVTDAHFDKNSSVTLTMDGSDSITLNENAWTGENGSYEMTITVGDGAQATEDAGEANSNYVDAGGKKVMISLDIMDEQENRPEQITKITNNDDEDKTFNSDNYTFVVDSTNPKVEVTFSDNVDRLIERNGNYFAVLKNPVKTGNEEAEDVTVTLTLSDKNLAFSPETIKDGDKSYYISDDWKTPDGGYEIKLVEEVEINKVASFIKENLRAVDLAGNPAEVDAQVTNDNKITTKMDVEVSDDGSFDFEVFVDRRPPSSGDDKNEPTIIITPNTAPCEIVDNNPLFNNNFELSVTVTDSHSGLDSIVWEIDDGLDDESFLDNSDTISFNSSNSAEPGEDAEETKTEDTVTKHELNVNVTFDGNHETDKASFKITATDNSGNAITYVYPFAADNLAPRVKVEYDNNEAANGKYFNENRTATVTVEELFFDSTKVTFDSNGKRGEWDGQEIKFAFVGNGEWNFLVEHAEDRAGNKAKVNPESSNIYGKSVAPNNFQIIEPGTLQFDVSRSAGPDAITDEVSYYQSSVTYTVTIGLVGEGDVDTIAPISSKEVSYKLKDGEDYIDIEMSKTIDGKAYVGYFTLNGSDDVATHGDVLTGICINVVDKAGNPVVRADSQSQTIEMTYDYVNHEWNYSGPFIEVDTCNPAIDITLPTNRVHNFNDVDYYDKEQKIVVKVTDVNFDPNNSEVSVTCGGNTFSFKNWKEDSDDTDSTDGSVYTATISISDKDADIITNGVAVSTVEVTAYDKADLFSKESRSSEGSGSSEESGKSKMTPFIVDTTKPTFEISFSENVEYFYQKQQVDDTYMYYLKLKKPVEIKNGSVTEGNEEETIQVTVKTSDANFAKETKMDEAYRLSDNWNKVGTVGDESNTSTYEFSKSITVDRHKTGLIEFEVRVMDLAGHVPEDTNAVLTGTDQEGATYQTTMPLDFDNNGNLSFAAYVDRRTPENSGVDSLPDIGISFRSSKTSSNGRTLLTGRQEDTKLALTVNDKLDTTKDKEVFNSGLKSVTWKLDDGLHGAYFTGEGGNSELLGADAYSETVEIVPIRANETNQATFVVTAEDMVGNIIQREYPFAMDNLAPRVTVACDRNNSGRAEYPEFFNGVRRVTVTITDINFNSEAVAFNPGNAVDLNQFLAWFKSAGAGISVSDSGENDTYQYGFAYTTDGEYSFEMGAADLAGNKSDINYAGFAAYNHFVVDMTPPVINVSFSNNDVRNGKYYAKERTASVTIRELNFSSTDIHSEITAFLDHVRFTAPTLGGWSEGLNHSSSVAFNKDGDYTMKIDFMDKAGNAAQTYVVPEFTIDMTAPLVEINNIEDHSANKGAVAPVVVFYDINFDRNGIKAEATKSVDLTPAKAVSLNSNEIEVTAKGVTFSYNDLAHTRENDGVYDLLASITDLAGNTAVAEKTYSVNRFGSTYRTLDAATQRLLESGYTNTAPQLIIEEINPDTLKNQTVTVMVQSKTVELENGNGLKMEPLGGEGTWKGTRYTIDSSAFMNGGSMVEGKYTLTISSEDAAGNINSNRFNENKLEVNFVLDGTAPTVSVSGIEVGDSLQESSHDVTIFFDDDSGIQRVEIYLNGEIVKVLEGVELATAGGQATVTVNESSDDQQIYAVVYDMAGNNYTTDPVTFYINSNILSQFFHNKPLFFGSIGGVVLVVLGVLLLLKKKKHKVSE